MARKNLSEIKMRDFQEYEKVCQKLADREEDPEHNETVEAGGQEYRLSRNDVRHINSLRGEQTNRTRRNNRSRSVGRKGRLWVFGNVALFISIFLVILVGLGRLTDLNQEFFRALGGSLLLGAALSFWLRQVMEQAVQHGGMWRALGSALWRNPFDNPGMMASLGAAIMYVIDWWPHFGSNIVPTIVDLVKSIIDIVKSLVG